MADAIPVIEPVKAPAPVKAKPKAAEPTDLKGIHDAAVAEGKKAFMLERAVRVDN